MNVEAILKENPITDVVQKSRKVARNILNTYFRYNSREPFDIKQKEEELQFFKDEIQVSTKKWITEILWELETYNGLTFNKLKRNIGGISSRSLSDRLKELKQIGLISRNIQETRPPKVLYQLTDKGKGYVELMTIIAIYLKER